MIVFNIFVLDVDVKQCAIYHCDKHVVKMPTETAQILSDALRHNGCDYSGLYKSANPKHPCVRWASESRGNYIWLSNLGSELYKEYKHRYGDRMIHKGGEKILEFKKLAEYIQEGELTNFARSFGKNAIWYRDIEDTVEAYRQYYRLEKQHILKYSFREKPWWIEKNT